jgi:hypothetical protein
MAWDGPRDQLLEDGDNAIRFGNGRWYAALETGVSVKTPHYRHARWLRGEAGLFGRPNPTGRVVLEGYEREEPYEGKAMVRFTKRVKEYRKWPRPHGRIGAVMECLPDEELLPLSLAHAYRTVRGAALEELRTRSLR